MSHRILAVGAIFCTTATLAVGCGTGQDTTPARSQTTRPPAAAGFAQQAFGTDLITFERRYKVAIAPTASIAKRITKTLQQATHPHPTSWLQHRFGALSRQLARSNRRLTRLKPPATISRVYRHYLDALYTVQRGLAAVAASASHNSIPKVHRSAARLVHAISLTAAPNLALNKRLGLTRR